MKKCLFILPYFGKFNIYFDLFLRSCGVNPSYNWLILTDDQTDHPYPKNVEVIYTTFDDFRGNIQSLIDIDIVLDKPYRLCEYKPTYGMVINEYFPASIQGYEYWGFCDCDLLFGNLERMLDPVLSESYDMIFNAGHLMVFRNTDENNKRFLQGINGEYFYKIAFSAKEYSGFDESWSNKQKRNVHQLFLDVGAKVYRQPMTFNPSEKHAHFVQRTYMPDIASYIEEPYKKALYVWSDEGFFQIYEDKFTHSLLRIEYLYVHLQHRTQYIKMQEGIEQSNTIQILPTKFRRLSSLPETVEALQKINIEPLSDYSFIIKMYLARIRRKILERS